MVVKMILTMVDKDFYDGGERIPRFPRWWRGWKYFVKNRGGEAWAALPAELKVRTAALQEEEMEEEEEEMEEGAASAAAAAVAALQ